MSEVTWIESMSLDHGQPYVYAWISGKGIYRCLNMEGVARQTCKTLEESGGIVRSEATITVKIERELMPHEVLQELAKTREREINTVVRLLSKRLGVSELQVMDVLAGIVSSNEEICVVAGVIQIPNDLHRRLLTGRSQ